MRVPPPKIEKIFTESHPKITIKNKKYLNRDLKRRRACTRAKIRKSFLFHEIKN